MPTSPLRTCAGSPTCPNRVEKGVCRDCARKREARRGSRHARGYDADYVRVRDDFMAQPEHRWCAECATRGVQEPATECDHVIPFTSLEDPRRLDPTNFRALCGDCHHRKTAAQQRTDHVIWNGEQDRNGTCPSLVDGTFSRRSSLAPGVATDAADRRGSFHNRAARLARTLP